MVFNPVGEIVRERAVEKRGVRIMQGFGGLKQRVGDFIFGALRKWKFFKWGV